MLEAKDIVSMTLGGLGLGLSLINLWRSLRDEKRSRSMAFSQKKLEADTLLLKGEVAHKSARRQLLMIRTEAKMLGLDDLAERADSFIAGHEKILSDLETLSKSLTEWGAKDATQEELMFLVDEHIAKIQRYCHPELIENTAKHFIAPAEKAIKQADGQKTNSKKTER